MKLYKYISLVLFLSLLSSCGESLSEGIEGSVICDITEIEVSESDNIVIPDNTTPVLWKGSYTDTTMNINFTKDVGTDGETETMVFEFTKVNGCLQLDRGYKYYYGSYGDVSAVTQMYILELYINEWVVDKKFTGQVIYRDHHDKQIYTYNFWVEFTTDDYEVEDTNYTYFSDCLINKFPIDIDVDKNGTTDYSIVYEEYRDTGNSPHFNSYEIKLVSADEENNKILAPRSGSAPYPIVFETPFATVDTKEYSSGLKNTLDIFYEFDAPYEKYNFFLNNNLTYKNTLKNNKEDYFLVKMYFGDKKFYGWIKFEFNAPNCEIEIIETFLNPIETKNVSLED
jgi:hypothetical protein